MANELSIKILGSGCRNCVKLSVNVAQALNQLGVEAKVEKITDFPQITAYGVMSTPALVINEVVVSAGKVLRPSEVVEILEKV